MNATLVSLVGRASDTATRDISIEQVLEVIRTGGKRIRRQVELIRRIFKREFSKHGDYKQAKKAIDAHKRQFPAVTWSGVFSERASDKLVQYSGLLCADLDSLDGELFGNREKLLTSPHLWALFRSSTGDGLKAVFRVPADVSKHAGSFRAVEKHVRELTGIQIDQACKDVARLCFISYDPDLYVNPNAVEIEPLPEAEKPRATFSGDGAVNLSERQRIAGELLGHIEWQSETSGFVQCPGKHLHTTADGERDCKIDFDHVPTLHCFHDHCRGILDAINRAAPALFVVPTIIPIISPIHAVSFVHAFSSKYAVAHGSAKTRIANQHPQESAGRGSENSELRFPRKGVHSQRGILDNQRRKSEGLS
jgi:VirE N-terminal domain